MPYAARARARRRHSLFHSSRNTVLIVPLAKRRIAPEERCEPWPRSCAQRGNSCQTWGVTTTVRCSEGDASKQPAWLTDEVYTCWLLSPALVGLHHQSLSGGWEPTLSWNQLHQQHTVFTVGMRMARIFFGNLNL